MANEDIIVNRFQTANQFVATYPYADVDEGTGIQIYYGLAYKNTVTVSYALSKTQIYSNTSTNATGASPTTPSSKILDLDFDVKLNLPKRIIGKIFVNIPVEVTMPGTGSGTNSYYVTGKLRRWDGSTETDLANATSETVGPYAAASGTTFKMLTFMIDASAGFNYKSTETIRVTLEVYGEYTGTAIGSINVLHDPKNVNTGNNNVSQMAFAIPFKLNSV